MSDWFLNMNLASIGLASLFFDSVYALYFPCRAKSLTPGIARTLARSLHYSKSLAPFAQLHQHPDAPFLFNFPWKEAFCNDENGEKALAPFAKIKMLQPILFPANRLLWSEHLLKAVLKSPEPYSEPMEVPLFSYVKVIESITSIISPNTCSFLLSYKEKPHLLLWDGWFTPIQSRMLSLEGDAIRNFLRDLGPLLNHLVFVMNYSTMGEPERTFFWSLCKTAGGQENWAFILTCFLTIRSDGEYTGGLHKEFLERFPKLRLLPSYLDVVRKNIFWKLHVDSILRRIQKLFHYPNPDSPSYRFDRGGLELSLLCQQLSESTDPGPLLSFQHRTDISRVRYFQLVHDFFLDPCYVKKVHSTEFFAWRKARVRHALALNFSPPANTTVRQLKEHLLREPFPEIFIQKRGSTCWRVDRGQEMVEFLGWVLPARIYFNEPPSDLSGLPRVATEEALLEKASEISWLATDCAKEYVTTISQLTTRLNLAWEDIYDVGGTVELSSDMDLTRAPPRFAGVFDSTVKTLLIMFLYYLFYHYFIEANPHLEGDHDLGPEYELA